MRKPDVRALKNEEPLGRRQLFTGLWTSGEDVDGDAIGGDTVVNTGSGYEGGATSFSATCIFSLLDIVFFWAVSLHALKSLLFIAELTASCA